jgi:hypothetical protein
MDESKKFLLALKYGSPVSDLEEIIETKKAIEDILRQREASFERIQEGAVKAIDSGENIAQAG